MYEKKAKDKDGLDFSQVGLPFTFREFRISAIAQSLAFLGISRFRTSHPSVLLIYEIYGKVKSQVYASFDFLPVREKSPVRKTA